jgi:hypothetical protein
LISFVDLRKFILLNLNKRDRKTGKQTTFLAITLMRDGQILWNVIPAGKKYINKARKGWLIYGKK